MAYGTGASRVEVTEETPTTQQIVGVATSVYGIVGVTERGPVGQAVECRSPDEYQRIFGKDCANGKVSHAVRGFFQNGGRRVFVTRVVHLTDPNNPNSKTSALASLELGTSPTGPSAASVLGANAGPFDLQDGDTIVLSVDGGSATTATFDSSPATRDNGSAGPFTLADNQTLIVVVDGGTPQNIVFRASEFANIAAATRSEVVAVLNAQLAMAKAQDTGTRVRISTDSQGTGATLNITGGTSNAQLGFTTGPTSGGGNVANINAVSTAEVKALVEGAVAGCTVTAASGAVRISTNTVGTGGSIQVLPTSSAAVELGLDTALHQGSSGSPLSTLRIDARYDGIYAHRLRVRIQNASNGRPECFNFQLLDAGNVAGDFPNLTMDPDDPRYAVTIISHAVTGSELVQAADLGLVGTALARRPGNTTTPPMAGGNDGLVGLVDDDFTGRRTSTASTGLYVLDNVEDLAIVSMPDRPTAVAQQALIAYCEVHRGGGLFPVLDPPANLSAQAMVDYVRTDAALLNASEFGSIYWPQVQVANPDRSVYGNVDRVVVPPSGHIAGVYARVDASQVGGVYQQPAGTEVGRLRGVLGFETDEARDVRKRGLVFDSNINPLAAADGVPPYIDGSRLLKQNGQFPWVGARRGVIFIVRSVQRALDVARHKNNTPALRRWAQRIVESFLFDQMNAGAFRSTDPDDAYFVDFGDGLNPDQKVFQGWMEGRIGLATNAPAEFIIIRLSQKTLSSTTA